MVDWFIKILLWWIGLLKLYGVKINGVSAIKYNHRCCHEQRIKEGPPIVLSCHRCKNKYTHG
jgi:hypothetical protein